MSNVKTTLSLFGFLAGIGFLAGCAWDNSPPHYHTVIQYDPSRAKPYISNVAPDNAPSARDWKTNQIVGVGYGSTGQTAPAAPGQAVGGATSTPSGVSYGGASGTTTTSTGSGVPGAINGNPPGTGVIGISPGTVPTTSPGPITASPAISAPPLGLNPTLSSPSTSSQYPTFSTPSPTGPTNTSSGLIFTNRYTAPTNSFSNPSLSIPRP